MFLYLPVTLDFSSMSIYNKHMNDTTTDELQPIATEKLLAEFSDFTIAELVLEIKEGREKLEYEQKLCAAKEFKIQKAGLEIEELTTRINSATLALNGDKKAEVETEED